MNLPHIAGKSGSLQDRLLDGVGPQIDFAIVTAQWRHPERS